MSQSAPAPQLGNPAAVGLAAFGMSTLLLQFHALGWMGMGPVLALALAYGALAQIIVGIQEFKTGNNFAYSVFTSFGCFWLAFVFIALSNKYGIFPSSKTDVGWFLVAWTGYSLIMGFASLRTNKMLICAFATVISGLVFLVAEHFGAGAWSTNLSIISFLATVVAVWYGLAHIIFLQVFGRDVLPVGGPVL